MLKLTSDQMLKRRVERVIKNDFYDFGSTIFALALAVYLKAKNTIIGFEILIFIRIIEFGSLHELGYIRMWLSETPLTIRVHICSPITSKG